jgi:hypothetical protein
VILDIVEDPRTSRDGLHRRDLIKGVTAAGLGLAAGGLSPSSVFALRVRKKK